MIELKIQISEIDYEALADLLAPAACDALRKNGGVSALLGKSPGVLKKALKVYLKVKGKDGAEKLLTRLTQQNSAAIIRKLEEFARQNGISTRIDGIEIESK